MNKPLRVSLAQEVRNIVEKELLETVNNSEEFKSINHRLDSLPENFVHLQIEDTDKGYLLLLEFSKYPSNIIFTVKEYDPNILIKNFSNLYSLYFELYSKEKALLSQNSLSN